MTTPTPLPHAVAIQMCSDFKESDQSCGDPNHSPESCTCLKLARAWRGMESDLAAAQEALRSARLFIAETGDKLPDPMYIETVNREGLAEDCKQFATGEVCAKYLDVKWQTERAIRAEDQLAQAQEARQAAEALAESYRQREETFRALIADDAYCSGFATLGEFRRGLIGWIDEKNSLDEYPEDGESPAIAGGPK